MILCPSYAPSSTRDEAISDFSYPKIGDSFPSPTRKIGKIERNSNSAYSFHILYRNLMSKEEKPQSATASAEMAAILYGSNQPREKMNYGND